MSGLQTLSAGAMFAGDFVIVRALAQGGMGAVYVAHQQSTGKDRALKVMHPGLAASQVSRDRFVQEAKVGAQIDSDHVVEVVGAGVDAATGMPWLAMELLQGEELAARILRGPLPLEEMREVFDQLCDALGKAHARGVVHRDLKPENVFIATARRRGVPFTMKILDFGIAKILKENQTAATVTSVIGSPMWMAPEQGDSVARLRPATDVWALGLMAFHALTGRSYWRSGNSDAPSLQAILTEVMVSPIVPPSTRLRELGVGVSLPDGFDGWFLGCVQRDPGQRYADANVAWAALQAVLGAGPRASVASLPPTQPIASTLVGQPVVAATVQWSTTQAIALPNAPPPARRGVSPGVLVAVAVGVGAAVLATGFAMSRPSSSPQAEVPGAVRVAAAESAPTPAPPVVPAPPPAAQPDPPVAAVAPMPSIEPVRRRSSHGHHEVAAPAPVTPADERPVLPRESIPVRSAIPAETDRAAVASPSPVANDLPERLDRMQITRALSPLNGAVRACGSGETGTAPVAIVINNDGTVRSATVSGQFAGTPVGDCINSVVRRAHFPAFRSPTQNVMYPYVIMQQR